MPNLETLKRYKTKTVKNSPELIDQTILVKGWIKTVRKQSSFAFLELNDGSALSNLQIIVDKSLPDYDSLIDNLSTGSAVEITGVVAKSPGANQAVEIQAKSILIVGTSPESYPLQKKRHSLEFLRTIGHLRPRTNTIGAAMRVRNTLANATHTFFQEKGFLYLHTPIITASDCEGAGELFKVTTLPPEEKESSKDFFGKDAYLTVSGQLNAEAYACSLGDVYTFGPTFRAENSHTSRHLAEFWMIEPELAFADLQDVMQLAEEYLLYLVKTALDTCEEDLAFFDKFIHKGKLEQLQKLVSSKVTLLSYTDAIDILTQSKQKFEFPCEWGIDLQSEHERFLCEKHFDGPVIVYDYPKAIKPFYMRTNDDNKTVAAMDLLVPGVGELVGGSQREERLSVLEANLLASGLDPALYEWYTDLRKYGTVPHAGFGLGFERLVQYVTGIENIRDVIPFPRYPGHADY